MLDLMTMYSARGVPACWVFEVLEDTASLTVFRAKGETGCEAASTTSDVFVTESPYPVSIDIHRLCRWWPETFEYVGKRRNDEDGG